MLIAALTGLIVVAWYIFAASERPPENPGDTTVAHAAATPTSTRLVLAGAGASAQIVLTCLALGTVGLLTTGAVGVVTILLAAALAGRPLLAGTTRKTVAATAAADLRAIGSAARASLGWETGILAALLLFAAIWLGTAVVVYPPRGVDDLVYHLPPVYQAVQTHRFEVLPLELRKFFAFPFNGEMPFLWVVLLTGSVRWVDGAQTLFVVLGMAAVVALGRALGLRPRGALFAAGLFGAMPVVLLQATSNYIDVIVNAWILAAAVALLAYARSGSRVALAVGGLTAGLVLGSKYQTIPFAALFAGIALVAALRRGERGSTLLRSGALFAVPAAGAGLFWYLRNWAAYANPFYPLPVTVLGTTLFPGDWPQGPSVWSALAKDPIDALRIAVWDPGLRSFNGGFGFLFWGLGLASWAWVFARWLRGRERPTATGGEERAAGARSRPWLSVEVLVLGLVPVGLFSLFLTPFDDLALTPRYVLAIGGIAFTALGALIEDTSGSRSGVASGLRGAGVLGAALGLVVAAGSNRPTLDLTPVAAQSVEVRRLGETRYLQYGLRALALMAEGWAPLDAMTRDEAGLTVYQATDFKIFWTGPTFGTCLQNRIWNFLPAGARGTDPEAFFFHSPSRAPFYLGTEIRRETVAADPRYELVAGSGDDVTTLYVMRTLLEEKGRRARLVDYYRILRPALVRATAPAAEAAEEGSALFATFPLASAFLVHEADGRLKAELVPLTTKELQAEGARRRDRRIYTLGVALEGRQAGVVREIEYLGQKVSLVRNEPASTVGSPSPSVSEGSR